MVALELTRPLEMKNPEPRRSLRRWCRRVGTDVTVFTAARGVQRTVHLGPTSSVAESHERLRMKRLTECTGAEGSLLFPQEGAFEYFFR